MRFAPFKIEQWFGKWEFVANYNIAESCASPVSLKELLTWDPDLRSSLENLDQRVLGYRLGYTESNGSEDLRREISSLYRQADPDLNVLVTAGASEANFLLFATLIQPGDEVITEFPTYNQHYELPQAFGATFRPWRLREENNWLPDIDELRRLVSDRTRLIVITHPHNPTGSIITPDMLKEICEVADSVGAWVLSDEVFKGLNLSGEDETPRIFDVYPRGISVSDMSKAFGMSGLRIGWICGDPEVVKDCWHLRDYTTICNAGISERIALSGLRHREAVLERNLAISRTNYALLSQFVSDNPRISMVPPKGGVLAFPRLDTSVPSMEWGERLVREKGVLIVPGACFEMEGYFRIGFGYDTEKLKTGLQLLSEFLKTLP
ncbi:MAG: aminotransferase class I/II-fold pyridoxal phosphate-dependent enzyme [Bacillota bacterium]